MTAVNRPMALEQGATFTLGMNWHRPDEVDPDVPGTPYDLSGWSARLQIRKEPGAPVLLNATTENEKISLGTTNGRIDIKFSAADTAAINIKTAYYDLELENPDGDVFRLLYGRVKVSQNITV